MSTAFLGVEQSLTGRRWVGLSIEQTRQAEAMAQRTELPRPLCATLARLGVPVDAAESYLTPALRDLLPDPSVLKDMDAAADRLADAVRKRIPKVEVIDDQTVKFYFTDGISRRSLIEQVATVPVFSKAWYEKTGARLDEARLTTSPGSGPYVLDEVEANRRVVYKRKNRATDRTDYFTRHPV